MSNRRSSLPMQLLTIAGLSAIWAIARALRGSGTSQSLTGRPDPYYHIRFRRSGLLSLILFAADVYAIPAVLRGKPLIDAASLAALHHGLVPRYNRRALLFNAAQRARYGKISDRVLQGIIALPLLLLLDRKIRRDAATLGMLYTWMHAITYTLYSYSPFGPAFNDKYRPVVYYTDIPTEERILGNNMNSRYSGHTGSASAAAFFMAKVYDDYHPELSASERAGLYVLAGGPPLLLGWLRTRALKHFPTDVLMATVIGALCGIVIPELHKR